MLKGIIRAEGLTVIRGAVERAIQLPSDDVGLRIMADENVYSGEAGQETLAGSTSFVRVSEGDQVHIAPVARDVMAANMEALLAIETRLGDSEASFAWTDKSMRFHWLGITEPMDILFPRPNELTRSRMKFGTKRLEIPRGFSSGLFGRS